MIQEVRSSEERGDGLKRRINGSSMLYADTFVHGVAAASSIISSNIENATLDTTCFARRRIFLYSMCISVASHLTSILLSMAFVNALNEAGRDSDVIRMFGEGQVSLGIGLMSSILIALTS